MARQNQNFLQMVATLEEEKHISIFCRDQFDDNVSMEHKYYDQAKIFLATSRIDCKDADIEIPDGFDYLVLAIIGKNMLSQSSQAEIANVVTGITLAIRALTPMEMDEVGTSHRPRHNKCIYNMRNKLLMDWFHRQGIWKLVSNEIAINKQFDKIQRIKMQLDFGPMNNDEVKHDIYLLKTKNFTLRVPGHYILLINRYCFHLTNIGVFAGDYRRMKARLFESILSFERVGATSLDIGEIDHICQVLASQSHSIFFNNCQNFATNAYNAISDDKGVRVELPSFSGTTVIIQSLLLCIMALLVVVLIKMV